VGGLVFIGFQLGNTVQRLLIATISTVEMMILPPESRGAGMMKSNEDAPCRSALMMTGWKKLAHQQDRTAAKSPTSEVASRVGEYLKLACPEAEVIQWRSGHVRLGRYVLNAVRATGDHPTFHLALYSHLNLPY
jgi:hypothetical protein